MERIYRKPWQYLMNIYLRIWMTCSTSFKYLNDIYHLANRHNLSRMYHKFTLKNTIVVTYEIFLNLIVATFYKLLMLIVVTFSSMTGTDYVDVEKIQSLLSERIHFISRIRGLLQIFLDHHPDREEDFANILDASSDTESNRENELQQVDVNPRESAEHDAMELEEALRKYGAKGSKKLSKVFLIPASPRSEKRFLSENPDLKKNPNLKNRRPRKMVVEITCETAIKRSVIPHRSDFHSLEDTSLDSYRKDFHGVYAMLKSGVFPSTLQNTADYFSQDFSYCIGLEENVTSDCPPDEATGTRTYNVPHAKLESYDVHIHDLKTETNRPPDLPFSVMIGLSARRLDIFRMDRSVQIAVRLFDRDTANSEQYGSNCLYRELDELFSKLNAEMRDKKKSMLGSARAKKIKETSLVLEPGSEGASSSPVANQDSEVPTANSSKLMTCRSSNPSMQIKIIGYNTDFYLSDDSGNSTLTERDFISDDTRLLYSISKRLNKTDLNVAEATAEIGQILKDEVNQLYSSDQKDNVEKLKVTVSDEVTESVKNQSKSSPQCSQGDESTSAEFPEAINQSNSESNDAIDNENVGTSTLDQSSLHVAGDNPPADSAELSQSEASSVSERDNISMDQTVTIPVQMEDEISDKSSYTNLSIAADQDIGIQHTIFLYSRENPREPLPLIEMPEGSRDDKVCETSLQSSGVPDLSTSESKNDDDDISDNRKIHDDSSPVHSTPDPPIISVENVDSSSSSSDDKIYEIAPKSAAIPDLSNLESKDATSFPEECKVHDDSSVQLAPDLPSEGSNVKDDGALSSGDHQVDEDVTPESAAFPDLSNLESKDIVGASLPEECKVQGTSPVRSATLDHSSPTASREDDKIGAPSDSSVVCHESFDSATVPYPSSLGSNDSDPNVDVPSTGSDQDRSMETNDDQVNAPGDSKSSEAAFPESSTKSEE